MLSTFDMTGIYGPTDRVITRRAVPDALHHWIICDAADESAHLSQPFRSSCSAQVPCWLRLVGLSSQVQIITASRWLMFSSSQPSRRRSRILRLLMSRLSLTSATFNTSIHNSVFFLRCRSARSSSSCPSRGLFRAHQHPPSITVS